MIFQGWEQQVNIMQIPYYRSQAIYLDNKRTTFIVFTWRVMAEIVYVAAGTFSPMLPLTNTDNHKSKCRIIILLHFMIPSVISFYVVVGLNTYKPSY